MHFQDRRKVVPSQPEKTSNYIRNNQIFVHIVTRWAWNFDMLSGAAASTTDRKPCSQVYICIQIMHEGWLQCSLDLLSLISWGAGGVPVVDLCIAVNSTDWAWTMRDPGSNQKQSWEPCSHKNEVRSMWPSSVHNQTLWLAHHWLPHSFIFISQQQSPPMLYIVMKRATVMQPPPQHYLGPVMHYTSC